MCIDPTDDDSNIGGIVGGVGGGVVVVGAIAGIGVFLAVIIVWIRKRKKNTPSKSKVHMCTLCSYIHTYHVVSSLSSIL